MLTHRYTDLLDDLHMHGLSLLDGLSVDMILRLVMLDLGLELVAGERVSAVTAS